MSGIRKPFALLLPCCNEALPFEIAYDLKRKALPRKRHKQRQGSTLPLLVARVAGADHHHAAVASDDAAVLADGLDGGLDLHE
jgi:hypothetical protein